MREGGHAADVAAAAAPAALRARPVLAGCRLRAAAVEPAASAARHVAGVVRVAVPVAPGANGRLPLPERIAGGLRAAGRRPGFRADAGPAARSAAGSAAADAAAAQAVACRHAASAARCDEQAARAPQRGKRSASRGDVRRAAARAARPCRPVVLREAEVLRPAAAPTVVRGGRRAFARLPAADVEHGALFEQHVPVAVSAKAAVVSALRAPDLELVDALLRRGEALHAACVGEALAVAFVRDRHAPASLSPPS